MSEMEKDIQTKNEKSHQKCFGINLLKIFAAFICSITVIVVFIILILPNGEMTLLGCRIVAAFGMFLMGCSTFQMIKIYRKVKNKTFHDEKPMPVIMGFFVSFMTMVSLYGYFSKISKIIIYRNFDFVLHYDNQILELTIDSIYIFFVCVFLITQLLFFLIVAPVSGIGKFNIWLFCITLFTNSLQKWLFKSTVVHMDLCEKANKNGDLCSKFMHYESSYVNLTKEEEKHYYSIKEIEPLTYTITMELFVACIGLNLFFGEHKHHPEILPEIQKEIKPCSLIAKFSVKFAFFLIFVGLLFIIIASPIISVSPENIWLSETRVIIRCITHLANTWLLWYMILLFKIPFKLKWASEADIIIMWIAGIINAIKALSKCAIHCSLLCRHYTFREGVVFGIAQIGNTLESVFFYFLILVVERLILIADQPNNENTKRHLSKFTVTFLPLYFCTMLLGFAAYYNLNGLKFTTKETLPPIGVNLMAFLQSTYPTTMLFTTTACLCIASIMEKLYQKGYYRLTKNVEEDNGKCVRKKYMKIMTHV